MTRRERLRLIRADLLVRLELGEFDGVLNHHRGFEFDLRVLVWMMLDLADKLERWTPEEKRGESYARMSSFVAGELERISELVGAGHQDPA